MRLQHVLALLTLASVGLEPCIAVGQKSDRLEAAELAYKEVDFERQRSEATLALTVGHNDPARLARIYRLLGIADAALNAPDEAKQNFMKLLAIDPDVALEHVLSPRLRTPYMEARGFWDVTSARLEVQLDVRAPTFELEIAVTDPLLMGTLVRVTARGREPTVVAELEPLPRLVIARQTLEPHDGEPLQVELLDRYANVILVRAMAAREPPAAARVTSAVAAPASEHGSDDSAPLPLATLLSGGALLALGVGVSAHVIRENRASEWNGSGCERTGQGTRAEQCGNVDDRRRSAQNVAIIGYAAGGALLAAGVMSYLLASGAAEEPPELRAGGVTCGGDGSTLGLRCGTVW